jgi:hypothetical protein
MVRDNYVPDKELLTMGETTRQASEAAHEQMVATKERLLAQKRGVERERLHRVNAELRDYSTVRDKGPSPSSHAGMGTASEPAQVPLHSPAMSAFRPALPAPSALPTPMSSAGSFSGSVSGYNQGQGQYQGQQASAFSFTTPQGGQWQQHQQGGPAPSQPQWQGQFVAQSAPPTPARPNFAQQHTVPPQFYSQQQQQARMASPAPQRQATAPAGVPSQLPPRAPVAVGR